MFNIVYYQDLRAAGAASALVRESLECCLLKLGRGVYSVIRRCVNERHLLFAQFIDNDEWIRYHEGQDQREQQGRDPALEARYREHLNRLRILSYPSYRSGDAVWGISAAYLHRIRMFDVPRGPISVIHPRDSSRTAEIERRRRPTCDDVEMHEGVVMTTPARTAVDLISILGPAAGFAAMEQVLRRHLLGDDEELIFRLGYPPQLMDDVPGAVEKLFAGPISRMTRGSVRAKKLAKLVSPLSESYAESRTSLLLHQLGLHEFVQQVTVFDGGRKLTRLDFLLDGPLKPDSTDGAGSFRDPADGARSFPDSADAAGSFPAGRGAAARAKPRVALYVDGTQKYADGGFDTMNKESRQHNRLLAMGYKVIRFKFNEVMSLFTFKQKLFSQAPELKQLCDRHLLL
ncbi:hypothetical protein [Brevibacterium renqingii]|uniref:hypothetical protein n=1 Tax=Brevibacterium renqingii TaxID=2776916 RepID=UPI001AE054E1|nr:hypothetical protein [Brevibacterium renqingii]